MQITLLILFLTSDVTFFAKRIKSASALLANTAKNPAVDFGTSSKDIEADEIYLNYRLPNETYPEHYDIQLTTDIHLGVKYFQGKVIIDVVIANATSSIILHARQQKIHWVVIENLSTGESELLSYDYELEREFLTLTRKNRAQFDAGSKWKLKIAYYGELSDEIAGFYWSIYVDDEGNDHYLATTLFENTDARHAFPCYDEPDKRATFTITINHSPTYAAISNMPVNQPLSSATKTVFLTTARIATYAVAFTVSDFVYTEGVLQGLTQRVYSRPNAKQEHNFALISGMQIAQYFVTHYGVRFRTPKIDHIAIPDYYVEFKGGRGLLTYDEQNVLYNENKSTIRYQNIIGNNVAYQIFLQLLGDYVTIKCWDYFWLREGLATLFAYKSLDHTYPEWDVWQEFHAMVYQKALVSDGANSARPLAFYVHKPTEISSLFDSNSHNKAGSVLFMWNNALTDEIFQKAFYNFLTENRDSTVDDEQFYTALQFVVEEEKYFLPATISEMISSWTRQSGYPILSVTRNYDNGTFTVKQEAYDDDETLEDTKMWYVPINYVVASDADFFDTQATHYLANVTEMIVNDVEISSKDWLLLNKQSTGYYRINYDTQNWNLITKSLIERPSTIHHLVRAQLIDDSHHLTISNRLDHATHLKLLSYLKQEDQLAAWNTALFILQKYNRYLKSNEKYEDFKYFMTELVGTIYTKLGLNEIPGEHHNNKLTRPLVAYLACIIGLKECLEETRKKFNNFVYKNKPIERNLEDTVYAFGLQQSSDKVFNIFFQTLLYSTDDELRNRLIIYLSYTQNENQIKKLIYSSIDKKNSLSLEQRHALLQRTYSKGGVSLMACIEFLNENWNAYGNLKEDNSRPLNEAILDMASYVVNKIEGEKLLALVHKVKKSDHVTFSLQMDVKSTIDEYVDWFKKHGDPIMAWISRYRAANQKVAM